MKMQIDSNACTGHGRCYTLAPHLVEPDDMGYAVPSGVPIDIDPADEALAKKLVGTLPGRRDLGPMNTNHPDVSSARRVDIRSSGSRS